MRPDWLAIVTLLVVALFIALAIVIDRAAVVY